MTESMDLHLGPLAFACPVGPVGESVGDPLEAVGATLLQAERKPRPLKLPLATRIVSNNAEGLRLRRQIRQLLNNAAWRRLGFYLAWAVDPDLDGWVAVGSGDLSEVNGGLGLAEWNLELGELFVVGRPGTHRTGRRASVADLRSGEAPRDSRRLLYSGDFHTTPLPTQTLYLPGDSTSVWQSSYIGTGGSTQGGTRGARHLWRRVKARDGEVVVYVPDPAVLSDPLAFLELDDAGAVKVWDVSAGVPGAYTQAGDEDPTTYGWERVYGPVAPTRPLAIENGIVRVVWLGPGETQGLSVEVYDEALKHYARAGRALHARGVVEQRVVELTPERGVIEWRAGPAALRVVLQRGWPGPRLESYHDEGEPAVLEYQPVGSGTLERTVLEPSFVRQVQRSSGSRAALWAQGASDEVVSEGALALTEPAATWQRGRVLVAQLALADWSAEELAGRSLLDARPVPVLVGRS